MATKHWSPTMTAELPCTVVAPRCREERRNNFLLPVPRTKSCKSKSGGCLRKMSFLDRRPEFVPERLVGKGTSDRSRASLQTNHCEFPSLRPRLLPLGLVASEACHLSGVTMPYFLASALTRPSPALRGPLYVRQTPRESPPPSPPRRSVFAAASSSFSVSRRVLDDDLGFPR